MPDLDATPTPGLLRRARSIPRVVWLITAVHGFLLLGYSVLMPAYRAPDEHLHVDRVLHGRADFRFSEFDETRFSARVLKSRRLVAGGGASRNLEAWAATPRGERPTFNEIPVGSGRTPRNLAGKHPPLYYSLMAGMSTLITSVVPGMHWSWDKVVGMLRILNVLLVLGLPLIAFVIARRLGWSLHTGAAAAVFPLAIPMLYNIGASVNNDNLVTILGAVLTLLLVLVATGDNSVRTTVWVGVVGGLAFFTKAFAFVIPMWLAAGYAVSRLGGGARRSAVRLFALALTVTTLVGGWWWARNYILFGMVQPRLSNGPRSPADPGFEPDWLWWSGRYLRWLMERFWGAFGLTEITLPQSALVLASILLMAAVVAAVFLAQGRVERWRVLLLLVPFLTLAGVTTFNGIRAYLESGRPVFIHGRYLFPAIAALGPVVAFGLSRLLRGWSRHLPALMLVGAAAMQALAVWTILPWYWGPSDRSIMDEVWGVIAWSPWPGTLLVAFAVLAVIVTTWLVVHVVSLTRARSGVISNHLERQEVEMGDR